MGGEFTLPIPELRPEDLQDNILATIGDALTTLLEEELAAEAAAQSAMAQSAEAKEHTKSTGAEGRPANAVPTQSGS